MNTLREAIHDYIDLRRSLGFKLREARGNLLAFAAFMERRQAPYITAQLALEWAKQPVNVQPSRWARRLSDVRVFARHRKAADPRTEIPAAGLLPFKPKRAKPHLYTDEEIRKLLQAAISMPYTFDRDALRPWLFHCLFGLLAVSGIRVGEARNIKLQDIDLDCAVLTLRGAKFGRERLIALHPSTRDVIADYIVRRAQHWRGRSVGPWLFVSNRGNQLDSSEINRTFHKLSRQIGLRGENDSHGPRLHDMRHSFATNTLLNWYRQDQDPERHLPTLSTWLGHVKVTDTQWYLEACPELMREAMRRLESRWEDQS